MDGATAYDCRSSTAMANSTDRPKPSLGPGTSHGVTECLALHMLTTFGHTPYRNPLPPKVQRSVIHSNKPLKNHRCFAERVQFCTRSKFAGRMSSARERTLRKCFALRSSPREAYRPCPGVLRREHHWPTWQVPRAEVLGALRPCGL